VNHFHDYRLTRKALESGETTCVEVVNYFLKNIQEQSDLNAYLEVFQAEAVERAAQIDAKIRQQQAIGKLAGMVISIKDNICYRGHKVSASSRILEGFESVFSSTVVERLLAEDAIIIGRTNCDEFAMGSSNEKSAYGPVLNPVNKKTVPGGSSGGAAASAAAHLCHVALGTDTGGSIRQPAAYTGVVGLKPTYGRVSRHGIIAYASSFDQVGPLSRSVYESALVFSIIAGKDEFDSTLSGNAVPTAEKLTETQNKKYKIVWLKECLESEGLDAENKALFMQTIEKLKAMGHHVEPVSFPYLDYLVPAYYVLTTAEASSNLARYDGIHYGYRSPNATDLESTYKLSRSEGFGKEVKRRIMLGTFVLSEGYYDAYYGNAQKARRILKNYTDKIFEEFDLILTPTTPASAFEFGQKSADPVAMYLEDIFTVFSNLTGIPSLSVPMGKLSNNMPVGLQVMAAGFNEKDLLSFSANELSRILN
jgi:aspartyl-tRNA(Asn)/glutamyl-tRNA(Gln) amidotransferase subunit A